MLEIDLRSLKRFRTGPRVRFVLASDFGGRVPEEDTLRTIAREVTERLSPTGNPACAAQWVMSSQGWAGWLNGLRNLDDAEEWFNLFAASFSRTDGKIIGGPRERGLSEFDWTPTLAGNLYLTTADMRAVDSDERGWFWGIDETMTRYVCEQMMYWAHMPGATEWLANYVGDSFETRGLDHVESMAEMVRDVYQLRLEAALREPLRYRTAEIKPHGSVAIRVVDPTVGWTDRLALVKEILTWSAPRSDYGYVRHCSGIGGLDDDGKTWPHIDEAHVRYNRPLLTSFVPDAYGIQLLTDAHLARAHDLSDWDITPLDGGRHLVMARDLESWYRPIDDRDENGQHSPALLLPDNPDLIAKARTDFGDMIITPSTIDTHNPWR